MTVSNSIKRFVQICAASCLALAGSAVAQAPFTQADSGWVRIFNGVDWTGLYSRLWGATAQITRPPAAPFQIMYPGTDTAVIRVTSTSSSLGGNVGTDKTSYSHYRVRVEEKFDALAGGNNGGITWHGDETAIRMNNNWPRSIEFQMQQQDAGGAYSIQQVTATTTVTGSKYSRTGTVVQMCQYGCNARNYGATPLISNTGPNNQPRWLRYELVTRGSDSAIYIINDTVVFRMWNIRIFHDSTQTTSNRTPNQPWNHGGFGIQSEGALINYRRWQVMEFPPSTPMNEHFLHRLVLTNRSPIRPAVNSPVSILWRSIGTIPKVKLQYKMGPAGAWQTITDSTSNTGTYSWTSPATITDSLSFRISSYDYVIPDSTGPFITTGVRPDAQGFKQARFTVDSRGLILSGVEGFREAGITDIFGRQVRVMPVSGKVFRWDLADARGARVPKGLYFVQLKGVRSSEVVRVPVL